MKTTQMKQVLLVEDANFFARIIQSELSKAGSFEVTIARTYAEAREKIEDPNYHPFLALVDLTLPDAQDGEVVDLAVGAGLPTIVFSARFDEKTRSSILSKGIVDYVVKDSPASLSYLADLVRRIEKNQRTHVLIVEDAHTQRAILKERLERYCLQVHTACCGLEGIEVLRQNPQIQLLILDHGLPDISGFETLKKVRQFRHFHDLAIVGISATPSAELTAKFLKSGASDFVAKSCTPEELILRISQNLESLERIKELTELANKDPMTGLFNRRYLHDQIEQKHRVLAQSNKSIRYAMIDIDKFKQINDRFGHETGDQLIIAIADRIRDFLPKGAVAVRIGGDEFCVAFPELDETSCRAFLSELRTSMPITLPGHDDQLFNSTISVGLSSGNDATLSEALRSADRCLYEAKESGRNRIIAA
ncbi:diguanylate cyclase [Pseudovibrio exalbescens]|uniref:diguanylate cyclase n=1 Tax=Pseudovibrio exalbescens TaxID=197461 RepID=UPI0023650396|nr:diguanylate cyclase [Pseudovibrio exalbescens]MDD7912108.1 diguanylate cyclase [Pseudovibrio exalbescens]